ncbi:MAG: glycosyltransferase family 2 protein [Candidatus Nomurabacteria bacterium]|jgi:glycosyltransferase involved in cell wall biosynthesis|nr:glycosyltransferase family 2 protein [Candidatus Nomurabacteria bacterium]
MKKLITIIISVYNEERSLPSLFERLKNLTDTNRDHDFEFLFINDGSKDKTLSILQHMSKSNPHISYINFSRNFGKEIAVAAGIDHADGDAVVIMDADGQEPPELIPEMIKWWEKGYDDVYARRSSRKHDGLFKRMMSKMYYRTLQRMSRVPIQIDTGDFRLFSRRCILALRQFREAARQNKALFSWIGYKKKELAFDQGERASGKSKWKLGILSSGNSLVNLAIDGFTSFTTVPLRFVTLFGMLISSGAAIYIVVILIQAAMGLPRTGGYNTLLIMVLFLGGVQMISLGIIGEYVGRIFTETKNRPLYLIEELHKAKVAKNDKKDESEEAGEKY